MTKIFEGNQYILIRAGYSDPVVHSHMAAHIIMVPDGDMMVYSGDRILSCRGILIPSGTEHRIDTHGNSALIFLFDCTSNIAEEITEIREMPESMYRGMMDWYGRLEDAQNEDHEKELLKYLEMSECCCRVTDDRIIRAMEYIRSMSDEKITCGDVAEQIHLSQSRFSHLFKQETGMSFAGYRIYQRLMYVYAQVFRGKSITEAAMNAGFSGSSHFADINRRVFGTSMRAVIENASFYKLAEIWK